MYIQPFPLDHLRPPRADAKMDALDTRQGKVQD